MPHIYSELTIMFIIIRLQNFIIRLKNLGGVELFQNKEYLNILPDHSDSLPMPSI